MYIALDIGGTTTRIGATEDLKNFTDIVKYPTPQKFSEFSSKLRENLDQYENIEAIICGLAAQVDHHENKILRAPHISALDGKYLKEIFPSFKCPIYLENDAALAGLAESIMGEGKSFRIMAYITISTGVGGTVIMDKKLINTRYNFEPGHHIINFHGRELAVRNIKGSWESFSSGTGFRKRYGVEPAEYNDANLWDEYGEILAVGLHNIALLWQPEVIVLGGSMARKAPLFLKTLNHTLHSTLQFNVPEIRISSLGDENGLIGGLEYLKSLSI